MSKIIYFGDSNLASTSRHRADALQRLGHDITFYDPYIGLEKYFLNNKYGFAFNAMSGFRFIQSGMKEYIKDCLSKTPDSEIIWVNGGELFGAGVVKLLKKTMARVILYNNDDPTGMRDGNRFSSLLTALPLYDHCVVMRDINIGEYKAYGAKSIQRVWMSYDEIMHNPYENATLVPNHMRSEVSFIGTWMRYEGRDKFMMALADGGVPISIWGNRWEKSPYWSGLKNFYRGPAISGEDYVAAIQGAKISIGMLSKGNRDLHTTRSLEIPFAGGLLLAERTVEHQSLYEEDKEAVFWSSSEECAKKCLNLLENDALRESIRAAGMNRVRTLSVGNEDICREILIRLKK